MGQFAKIASNGIENITYWLEVNKTKWPIYLMEWPIWLNCLKIFWETNIFWNQIVPWFETLSTPGKQHNKISLTF